MLDLNGQTALYGIMGYPVAHSLSPLFQNYFLQSQVENAVYLPFAVDPAAIEQALAGLYASQVQGINVTVPHKENVLPFVSADADALRIGAVNTLKRTELGWEACNTDWLGFAAVLDGLQARVDTNSVLLFGAGGTSRAVCHALNERGVQQLWLCNRSQGRAEALANDVQLKYPKVNCNVLAWEQHAVAEVAKSCQVLINSSSVGLNDDDVFPFEFGGEGVALDAVYKPSGETAFVAAAKAAGFAAVDGLPMLVAQGIASFSYWHQKKISNGVLSLPDKLQSLRWVEQNLVRQPLNLNGWEI